VLQGVINEWRFGDGRGRGSYPEKLRNTTKTHISTVVIRNNGFVLNPYIACTRMWTTEIEFKVQLSYPETESCLTHLSLFCVP